MKQLSQVDFDYIRVGDRVQSILTERYGMVTDKFIEPKDIGEKDPENYWLVIRWENGNISYQPHFLLHIVDYIG